MDPGAEGEMAVRPTADIETIGISELRGIAIGRAYADMHGRACRDVEAIQNRVLTAFRLPSWFELSMRRNSSAAVSMNCG
jgi:hypothetical protein